MASLLDKLLRVFRFEAEVYSEVAKDTAVMGQAIAVVVGALGIQSLAVLLPGGFADVFAEASREIVRWLLWFGSLWILLQLFGTRVEPGALFRVLCFATAPFCLGLLQEITWIGWLFFAAKWGMGLAAFGFALQRVSELEILPALLLCAGSLAIALFLSLPFEWLIPA